MTKMGNHEFTVYLFATRSKGYFPDNTLANVYFFFKEEIALEVDWRVALSDIYFSTKINNVSDQEST